MLNVDRTVAPNQFVFIGHWTSQQTSVLLLCSPEKWDWNSETEVENVGESYRYLGQSSHTTLTDSSWKKSADRLLKVFYY